MTSLVLHNIITENKNCQNCYVIAVKFYFSWYNHYRVLFYCIQWKPIVFLCFSSSYLHWFCVELLCTRNYINANNQVIHKIKAIRRNIQQSKKYFIHVKKFSWKKCSKNNTFGKNCIFLNLWRHYDVIKTFHSN